MALTTYSENQKGYSKDEIGEARVASPFEHLNDNLIKQNEEFNELVNSLTRTLHRLSNTNVPTEPSTDKPINPETPFREGCLMNYYQQLNRMNGLITELRHQVNKINDLV